MNDPALARLHERVDQHATRLGQLEGHVQSMQGIQKKHDYRLEKVEQTNQQLLLSVSQVQNQLTSLEKQSLSLEKTILQENRDNREIINKLLVHDQERDKQMVNLTEEDKKRNQERWLKVWGILGPVVAAAVTAWFGIK